LTGRSEGIHEIPVDILCKTLKRHSPMGHIAEYFAHHSTLGMKKCRTRLSVIRSQRVRDPTF
jgi:hypothetical protein